MKLTEIQIHGFKSIDNEKGQTIPLGDVTVLLGANGSGKSNVISFFEMFSFMLSRHLERYIDLYGTDTILYYGAKNLCFALKFQDKDSSFLYEVELIRGVEDTLRIHKEHIFFRNDRLNKEILNKIFSGNNELSLEQYIMNRLIQFETTTFKSSQTHKDEALSCADLNAHRAMANTIQPANTEVELSIEAVKNITQGLLGIRAYQFHDTSDRANIKGRVSIDDAKTLHQHANNLAAFLKMLKESDEYNKYYQRIVRRIQQVMPQFGDFSLETLPHNSDSVRLNWYEKNNTDYLFGPHQISDGSLRFMALAALFLQPPDFMPSLIVVDEPELGLHPAAIAELAGMIRTASKHAQVLIATQSTRLVDEFSLEEVVVVERDKKNHCSVFKKLNEAQYTSWLEEYSLSELWEKNVLGGKP